MSGKIPANIKKIRELKNISQRHLATSLGITQAAYSHLENGKTKISPTKLFKISNAFGVQKEHILHFNVDKALGACLPNKNTIKKMHTP